MCVCVCVKMFILPRVACLAIHITRRYHFYMYIFHQQFGLHLIVINSRTANHTRRLRLHRAPLRHRVKKQRR